MATIYRRGGSKNWHVRYRDAGGELRWRSLGTPNRREAERERDRLTALEGLARRGGRPAVARQDIAWETLRARYEGWAQTHHRAQTRESRLRAIATWVRVTGHESLRQVTPAAIEQYRQARLREVGPRSVNEALSALRSLVGRAIREGWVQRSDNPFAGVEMLPEPKRPPKWLTKEQIARVIEVAELDGPTGHLYAALGIYAGLRKGESIGAQWEWVHWDAGVLQLSPNAAWSPKTACSVRAVPLHPRLQPILERYRGKPGEYLLAPHRTTWTGRYRTDVRKMHARIMAAAEVPWATPHTLRHTFASQLVQAGRSLYEVATLLGHTDVRTTQIYAHLAPERIIVDW